MKKILKISIQGAYDGYEKSFLPCLIQSLGYIIKWMPVSSSDLCIYGSFYNKKQKYKWVPKPLRNYLHNSLQEKHRISLFHSPENQREDLIPCDYAITSNFTFENKNHFRLPYWMEMIDWTHEGVTGNSNPRFGQLLPLSKLLTPIGSIALQKPYQAALFASHMREPRMSLLKILSKAMPVHGYGSCFDSKIINHSSSGIYKLDILNQYAFNLCPENSMHPGYYTEKIPESIAATCIPITWTDINVCMDFNSKAFINLAPMIYKNPDMLLDIIQDMSYLKSVTEQPLLFNAPTLDGLKIFMQKVIGDALS